MKVLKRCRVNCRKVSSVRLFLHGGFSIAYLVIHSGTPTPPDSPSSPGCVGGVINQSLFSRGLGVIFKLLSLDLKSLSPTDGLCGESGVPTRPILPCNNIKPGRERTGVVLQYAVLSSEGITLSKAVMREITGVKRVLSSGCTTVSYGWQAVQSFPG